ncbi:MAG: 30S ribosomal protein S6 [Lentisphaerae bacterium]|nr:30S ribosomal protein S6 [Lentisphaerota bacterium]MCP4100193.1 30S ribosomal protein S6 [Lentisphaerota bacterium]
MNKYEAIFILDIRKVDDEGKTFTSELTEMIKEWSGEMVEAVSLGRSQFAYEIKKRKAGIYWNYVFTADSEKVMAIKNKFRLDERVLRNMIIKFDRPEVVNTVRNQAEEAAAEPAEPAAK